MKLEKFRAGNKKKVTVFSIMAIIIILMAGIIIYQSYALYEEKKSFNVLNGTVPLFGNTTGTVELAYTIDGAVSNKPFPKKTDGYGAQSVVCDAGVTASWNDVDWSLITINPNNNKQIKCTINFTKIKIYGIERELTSTSSAWTRTNDAVGKVANAQVGTTSVQNDFDNIYPWSEIKSYNYNTSTKKITAWYGDSNFKFDGTNGEVLTYIPEFYYKRYQDGEKEYIAIAKKRLDGYTKNEAFSVGRYTMSKNSRGVHSKSGVTPLVNTTIADFRTYARNLGSGFGQLDWHYFIIQMLYLVEYADYNSQTKIGLGYSGSNASVIASGGCDALGMHSGSKDGTDKTSIIYRGIEDIYGNLFQFVDGINIKDNQAYACYDQNRYESDKFDGCYQKLSYISSNVDGYIKKLGYDANNSIIAFPTEVTLNVFAINDRFVSSDGNKVLIVGGRFNSTCGMFQWEYGVNAEELWYDTTSRLIKIN